MALISHDSQVQSALQAILETRTEHPEASLSQLLDGAGMKYNLSPLDTEKLGRLLREALAETKKSTKKA